MPGRSVRSGLGSSSRTGTVRDSASTCRPTSVTVPVNVRPASPAACSRAPVRRPSRARPRARRRAPRATGSTARRFQKRFRRIDHLAEGHRARSPSRRWALEGRNATDRPRRRLVPAPSACSIARAERLLLPPRRTAIRLLALLVPARSVPLPGRAFCQHPSCQLDTTGGHREVGAGLRQLGALELDEDSAGPARRRLARPAPARLARRWATHLRVSPLVDPQFAQDADGFAAGPDSSLRRRDPQITQHFAIDLELRWCRTGLAGESVRLRPSVGLLAWATGESDRQPEAAASTSSDQRSTDMPSVVVIGSTPAAACNSTDASAASASASTSCSRVSTNSRRTTSRSGRLSSPTSNSGARGARSLQGRHHVPLERLHRRNTHLEYRSAAVRARSSNSMTTTVTFQFGPAGDARGRSRSVPGPC